LANICLGQASTSPRKMASQEKSTARPKETLGDQRSRACHEAAVWSSEALQGKKVRGPAHHTGAAIVRRPPPGKMLAQAWYARSRAALISLKRERKSGNRGTGWRFGQFRHDRRIQV